MHHLNTNELQGRILIASAGDFWYSPGWPTTSTSTHSCASPPTRAQQKQAQGQSRDVSAGTGSGPGGLSASASKSMSTYFYNAKVDFTVDIRPGDQNGSGNEDDEDAWDEAFEGTSRNISETENRGDNRSGTIDAVSPQDHLAYADNFIGGFIGMVVRAEAQIDLQHQDLASNNSAISFIQGTVPNERMVEMAKERSVRLFKEAQRAWPGGFRPPPLKTPKTATPQLNPAGKRHAVGAGVRMGVGGDKLADDARSLFQSNESRGRNAVNTAGVVVTQAAITTWGDRENDENKEYATSLVKWASSGPLGTGNIISGRRLIHECVQAGLYTLYEGNYSLADHLHNQCKFFDLF